MVKRILLLGFLLAAGAGALAQNSVQEPEQPYAVVNLSVCNMRRTPEFDAEMISQALRGTPVHVLAVNKWYQIQSPDTYTGWVHPEGIHLMTKAEYHDWNAAEKVVVTALQGIAYSKPSLSAEPVSDLAGGDRVRYKGLVNWFYEVEFPDGRIGYIPRNIASKESVWRENLRTDVPAILATARSMTGFPYIWAGMSPKGMDCSGYVRTVLFLHDIIIPRDAGPQSRVGQRIEPPDDFQPGDLIFFGRRDPAGIKPFTWATRRSSTRSESSRSGVSTRRARSTMHSTPAGCSTHPASFHTSTGKKGSTRPLPTRIIWNN